MFHVKLVRVLLKLLTKYFVIECKARLQ